MASLKSFKRSLAKKLTKELSKSLDKCLLSNGHVKVNTNTSYMCWLKEHREQFEICTKCDEKLTQDSAGKKTCPQCHSKISSKDVMILAGRYWQELPEEEKQHYVTMAKQQNK